MGKRRKIEYKIDENNCFICTSHKPDSYGYFRIKENKEVKMLHRVIYEECFDSIPNGYMVRHRCDNPSCINPEHLEVGTHRDNMDDRDNRNRTLKGSNHGMSKLSELDVLFIRKCLKDGASQASLAEKYKVNKKVIYDIKNRNIWKHI